jgi:putative lipoic acid-binding regulatory protein
LPVSGNLGVIILATDIEQMHHLEKELKKLGIKR